MRLSFVYSYYENPFTLNRLISEWKKYDEKILKDIEFIITDDCSRNFPLKNFNKQESLNVRFFEIQQKVNWNWLACRNIGAYYAKGKWILVTDIDHFISKEDIEIIYRRIKFLNGDYVYMMERRNLQNKRMNTHGNSFLMTREMYWKIGGYDETLSGKYSGTTMAYKKRVLRDTKGFQLINVPLHWISGDDVADSQTQLSREENSRDLEFCKKVLNDKNRTVRVLTFPYEEIKCG